MDGGYIKAYRSLKEKGYYKDSNYVHLWLHLLLSASYQEKEYLFAGKIHHLKPGQLITGRKSLAKDTGINESKIERILKCFEIEHQIEQQTFNKFRIITILNWDVAQQCEQQNEQPVNSQRTASEHNQERKELKKRSSTLPKISFNFSERRWEGITDKDREGWSKAYPACEIDIELAGMGEWLLANPDKIKSNYRRFVTNWLKRTQDKGGSLRNSGQRKTFADLEAERAKKWREAHLG